jgi:hypothetical protein
MKKEFKGRFAPWLATELAKRDQIALDWERKKERRRQILEARLVRKAEKAKWLEAHKAQQAALRAALGPAEYTVTVEEVASEVKSIKGKLNQLGKVALEHFKRTKGDGENGTGGA